MATVNLPTNLANRIMRVDLQLAHDSQLALQSAWTGSIQILERGYAHWTGSITIAPAEARTGSQSDDWLPIEAFLSSLNGVVNSFECPHWRPAADMPSNSMVRFSSAVNGILKHQVNTDLDDVSIGSMVRAGNRTYRIRAIDGDRTNRSRMITLDPQRPIAVDTVLTGTTTILVVSDQTSGVNMSLDAMRAGPWSLSFREAN